MPRSTYRKTPITTKYNRLFNSMLATKKRLAGPPQVQFSRYELDQIRNAKSQSSVNKSLRSYKQKPVHKRHIADETTPQGSVKAGNSLYALECTEIAQGDNINQRERQEIMVKGIKVTWYCENQYTDRVLNLRWFLVQEKGSTPGTLDADFFMGTGTSRMVNFSSLANSTHKMMYSINREKWTVLAEGKKTLGPRKALITHVAPGSSQVPEAGDLPNFTYMEEYFNVGKLVRYDGTGATDERDPIYFVYFFVDPITQSTSAVAGQAYSRVSALTYFMDPN